MQRVGRILLSTAEIAAMIALIAGIALVVRYPRQTVSHLTHWKGGPRRRRSYVRYDPRPIARLAVVGDIGHAGRRLDATGTAIAALGADDPYDALVLLGDHAYPRGDPAKLSKTVFGAFGPVLGQGTPLLAVLGNHDVLDGNGPEQMQRLGMPARWWSRVIGDVLLVGLDSNILDPNSPEDAAQRAFLERALVTRTARWCVVALHHPPYSAGYQGSDLPTRRAFTQQFGSGGVDLVLSAHDHDYQRSHPIAGVTYVVTGGAAHVRFTAIRDFTAAAYRERHFVEVATFPDRLVVRAIDQHGRVFDETTITPPSDGGVMGETRDHNSAM